MQKRDFLLRLAEKAVHTLHYCLGLIQAKDFEGALAALNRTFEEWFGWESEFVSAMPEEYLLSLLSREGRLDAEKAAALALLLKVEGDVYAARDDEARAFHRHLRALNLLLAVHEEGDGPSLLDEAEHAESLLGAVAPYELPAPTLHRLWGYHEARGAYSQAEDTLWQLLATASFPPSLVAEGERFYLRLLEQDEALLHAGGLPANEIVEGMAALRKEGGG